ncbi:MAG: hypothetical protein Q9159_007241 [Coniocarpon cinnabarinum]
MRLGGDKVETTKLKGLAATASSNIQRPAPSRPSSVSARVRNARERTDACLCVPVCVAGGGRLSSVVCGLGREFLALGTHLSPPPPPSPLLYKDGRDTSSQNGVMMASYRFFASSPTLFPSCCDAQTLNDNGYHRSRDRGSGLRPALQQGFWTEFAIN